MTMKSAAVAVTAAMAFMPVAAGATTYIGTQNIGNDSAKITVTTDGTLGVYNGGPTDHITGATVQIMGPDGNFTFSDSNPDLSPSANFMVTANRLDIPIQYSPVFTGFYVDGFNNFNSTEFGQLCIGSDCDGSPGLAIDEFTSNGLVQEISPKAYGSDVQLTAVGAVSAAPEPSSWALMIAGLAMIGGMMRLRPSRRRSVADAAILSGV